MQPTKTHTRVAFALASMLAASGCATDPRTGQPSLKETFASDDPCAHNSRNIGIGAGALLGAVVGNQFKHSNQARLLGAALGAAAGGLIGNDMDNRRCALSKIAKQYNLDMQVETVDAAGEVHADDQAQRGTAAADKTATGTVVRLGELTGGHFAVNSDQLTDRAKLYFAALADAYNDRIRAGNIADPQQRAAYIAAIAKRRILLVGHTDDTGNSRLNADLSERRAKSVSDFMAARGVPRESLYFQGAGEFYPIASNAIEEGRLANRRVEIVEVADQVAFERYLNARKPRYEFYRPDEAAQLAANDAPSAAALAAREPVKPVSKAPAASGKTTAGKAGTSREAAAALATAAGKARPAPAGPRPLDFGGQPLAQAGALAGIGDAVDRRSLFSLISTAQAAEPAVTRNCTLDRPRVVGNVKALTDGKAYRTSEHLPGLYGKTWTGQVNGHQIVVNKVAVLAGDGALANLPEFKVYADYDPRKNANPTAAVQMTPQANVYVGNQGVLYRMFLQGEGGMQCADIVFASSADANAKAGRLIYTHDGKLYASDFKPKMYK